MNVYLNKIDGIADAIVSMYFSKRSWTKERDREIRDVCFNALDRYGYVEMYNLDEHQEFISYMDKLVKWGRKHITMLRFIDFSITVEGLHRAGQDDWDAHACRFNNRIIRSSTRTKEGFSYELSSYYQDKVIPTDIALAHEEIDIPQSIEVDGKTFIKTVNGYIRKDLADNPDVRRGLYMESIPSNFIFKVNLTEWAHVYKLRNKNTHAHPEVQELAEKIADLLLASNPWFTRELFLEIEN